jgi:hypothetical protein
MKTWIHIALFLFALLLAVAFLLEWREARADQARLQEQLSQAEQALQRASANQDQRDKQLTTTLAQLDDLKTTVKSQKDILAKLPELLSLPKPLQQSPLASPEPAQTTSSGKQPNPDAPTPSVTTLPAEDLKPLYDFALDCKACQAKLATATADLADERTKTQALSRERDYAVKLAKGGSLRQRMTRALKWFALGAVVGTVAAKAH